MGSHLARWQSLFRAIIAPSGMPEAIAFRQHTHIRLNPKLLDCPPFARPTHPRLDFVNDQENIMPIA